jgi:hypothetical protein
MEIPQTYDEWKKCITQRCKIDLTPQYVAGRISIMSKPNIAETKKFKTLYGEPYLQIVLSWFRQAAAEFP